MPKLIDRSGEHVALALKEVDHGQFCAGAHFGGGVASVSGLLATAVLSAQHKQTSPALVRAFCKQSVRRNSKIAVFAGGLWEIGTLQASKVMVDGVKVLGARAAAIAAPVAGSTVDAEARTAISQILAAMRTHGLIEV